MKCKCGNNIEIKMASKVIGSGCEILTAMTAIVTAKCNKCKEIFQVPIKSDGAIVKKDN